MRVIFEYKQSAISFQDKLIERQIAHTIIESKRKLTFNTNSDDDDKVRSILSEIKKPEKAAAVENALKHFNLPYNVTTDGEDIIVDVFTITRRVHTEGPSGWMIYGCWEEPSGYRMEPSQMDEIEFGPFRNFYSAIEKLLTVLLKDEFRRFTENNGEAYKSVPDSIIEE
jgi:hypothetical protein